VYNNGLFNFLRSFMDLKDARVRYIRQMWNARRRGLEWHFTFESWCEMWQESGHWADRGNHTGAYYMCRKGDVGPYSPQNVEIKTASDNQKEAWQVRKAKKKEETRPDPWRPYERTSAWDYPHTSDWLRFSRGEA
jgi:hypothetical protein